MCGIVGAIGLINADVLQLVEKMNKIQQHRGPDGHGVWKSEVFEKDFFGASFGHRRLAILDLTDAACQPMVDTITGNAIVFNGEIYNYLELKERLEKESVNFRTSSDTEVILHAFRVWGKHFVTQLRGMFTIAVWDAASQKTFLYRDRLGIKPLYYTMMNSGDNTKQTLLFSSELKTLLVSDAIKKQLDPASVESFLWNGFVAGGEVSIIRDVFQVQAGYQIEVDVHGEILSKNKFWEFPAQDMTESNHSSIEEVHYELENSVKLHLASDVPLGVFLSGGIDSSAVASLAVQQGHNDISTYNLAFEEAEYSEAKYARAVAESLGTRHHEIVLTQQTFLNSLDEAMNSMDQPSFDGINTYFISREIREAGITVALAGTGGDELFGGYKSFFEVPRLAKVTRFLSCFSGSSLEVISNLTTQVLKLKYGNVPPQTRWGKIADILAVRGDVFKAFQTSYSLYTKDFLAQILLDKSRYTDYGLDKRLAETVKEIIQNQSDLDKVSTMELFMFIKERLMRDTDSASMAASLEVRVPLLDHVLLEKVVALEPGRRFEPLGKKDLLRKLAMPELEAGLFDRPKSGFVLPFDRWCRDALHDDVKNTLNDSVLCESVGLNPQAISSLYQAFISGISGIYWSRIWAIYSFLWWCRQYKVYL